MQRTSVLPVLRRLTSRTSVYIASFATVAGLGTVAAVTPTQAVADRGRYQLELETATVPQLQEAMSNRKITSEQLTGDYIERIRRLNTDGPGLNAVRVLNDGAIEEARQADRDRRKGKVRGPLHGIPVLVKDNIDVRRLPTTAGALALADSYPSDDAFLVKGLRAAGAVILGKTNLSEFANFTTSGMPSGYSGLGGQVLNPYDVSQTPSGSSSGSGAAAATGLAAVTVGTETSGSILSPAVANSLVGVKPTVGLVSRTGIVPIAASQDTAGPMTRSVYDAAALLTALTGVDPEDPATEGSKDVAGTDYTAALSKDALKGVRVGVAGNPNGNQAVAFNRALDVLRAQGATVVPVTVSTGGLPPGILTYEFKRDLNAYLARLPRNAPMKTLDDVVTFNLAHAADGAIKFGQTQLEASNQIDLDDPAAKAAYEADRDNGIAAARERIDSVLAAESLDAILFTGAGSAGIGARAQYPSVAVPIGYDPANGRPFGMSFLGTAYTEAKLLSFAYAYEQAAQEWRPPSVTNPSLFRCVRPSGKWQRSCAP
ncbi:amidase [Nonomuraea sp. K274]|uniref:Amidase n=1 Tax=Nonomuraea cypriaca TaxID=1187855 RepID=A0A931AK68_9ACTN|nr:amidase family protein [Nonomuraea cypriaca]MBF8194401.1 amidase [Nonomuraea cypriaca]